MKIQRDKIKPEIFKISSKLTAAGYKAYLVGGAVRDIIAGRLPHDYDILTDARCERIIEIFKAVVPYGVKHGTVLVIAGGEPYDVTSYNEGAPAPASLENDLAIRDFTINAMACDLTDLELIDLFGGLTDYREKKIKCVLSAGERFSKDPLRILRAIRQAAEFNFDIEETTFEAAKAISSKITDAAPERIMNELVKFFKINNGIQDAKYLKFLIHSGAWQAIFNKYFEAFSDRKKKIDESIFNENFFLLYCRLANEQYYLKLAWPLMFSLLKTAPAGYYKCEYKKIVKSLFELKFSRTDFDRIAAVIFSACRALGENKFSAGAGPGDIETAVKQIINGCFDATKVKTDIIGALTLASLFKKACGELQKSDVYEKALLSARRIIMEKHPTYIEDLAINGNEVQTILGATGAGAVIGRALKFALNAVIINKNLNSKEKLTEIILNEFKRN